MSDKIIDENSPEYEQAVNAIVRSDTSQMGIPVMFEGVQVGTASMHKSEDGEVWISSDLSHPMFNQELTHLSIYSSGESHPEDFIAPTEGTIYDVEAP